MSLLHRTSLSSSVADHTAGALGALRRQLPLSLAHRITYTTRSLLVASLYCIQLQNAHIGKVL